MATLVTGAFGCIGSRGVRGVLAAGGGRRLLAAGEIPVVYDFGDDPWRLRMIVGVERLRDVPLIKGDIADLDHLRRVVPERRITRIIHLAAWQVPLCRQDPAGGARVNVVGRTNELQ